MKSATTSGTTRKARRNARRAYRRFLARLRARAARLRAALHDRLLAIRMGILRRDMDRRALAASKRRAKARMKQAALADAIAYASAIDRAGGGERAVAAALAWAEWSSLGARQEAATRKRKSTIFVKKKLFTNDRKCADPRGRVGGWHGWGHAPDVRGATCKGQRGTSDAAIQIVGIGGDKRSIPEARGYADAVREYARQLVSPARAYAASRDAALAAGESPQAASRRGAGARAHARGIFALAERLDRAERIRELAREADSKRAPIAVAAQSAATTPKREYVQRRDVARARALVRFPHIIRARALAKHRGLEGRARTTFIRAYLLSLESCDASSIRAVERAECAAAQADAIDRGRHAYRQRARYLARLEGFRRDLGDIPRP